MTSLLPIDDSILHFSSSWQLLRASMVPRETWQISSPDLELESPVHVLARVRTSNCWSRAGQVCRAARAISTEPTRRHSIHVIIMTGGRSVASRARPDSLGRRSVDHSFDMTSFSVGRASAPWRRHNIDTIKSVSEGNSTHRRISTDSVHSYSP